MSPSSLTSLPVPKGFVFQGGWGRLTVSAEAWKPIGKRQQTLIPKRDQSASRRGVDKGDILQKLGSANNLAGFAEIYRGRSNANRQMAKDPIISEIGSVTKPQA